MFLCRLFRNHKDARPQARFPALSLAETASNLFRLSPECEATCGEHLWAGFGNTIREGSFRIGFEETPDVEILDAVLSVQIVQRGFLAERNSEQAVSVETLMPSETQRNLPQILLR